MTLTEMSAEYLRNIEPMEQRVRELKQKLSNGGMGAMQEARLRRRINKLEEMIAENKATAAQLKNYYQKKEMPSVPAKRKKAAPKQRKRTSKSPVPGNGAAAQSAGVSGIRAVLSGRHDAE